MKQKRKARRMAATGQRSKQSHSTPVSRYREKQYQQTATGQAMLSAMREVER